MTEIRPIPLNSLEKFMLAHESEVVSYNSQIAVEYKGDVGLEELQNAIDQAIDEIPLLRSFITITKFNFKRHYKEKADFYSKDVLRYYDGVLSQEELDNFCFEKFDLTKSPAFRFSLSKTTTGKNLLIFNVHHTLCDAAGQFHILEEIFRVINHLPIRDGAKTDEVFRYRSLWKFMGMKWFFKQIFDNLRPLSGQRQYKMAHLADHPEVKDRFPTTQTFFLTEEEQKTIRDACKEREISITEYLTYCCFKALDKSLKRRNDDKTPIMVYLPKTLRPFLKIRYSLQNMLTTVWIVGKREEIHGEKFLGKVKHVINAHKMDKAAKFIFGTLAVCSLMKPKGLQKIFKDMDNDVGSVTCSLVISAGRVPRSFVFPEKWADIGVWARGAMLKSPGLGVIFTGVSGNESISITYIKSMTKEATILQFRADLLNELLQIN